MHFAPLSLSQIESLGPEFELQFISEDARSTIVERFADLADSGERAIKLLRQKAPNSQLALTTVSAGLLIADSSLRENSPPLDDLHVNAICWTPNARLTFHQLANRLLKHDSVPVIESSAVISPFAKIGKRVSVGNFSVIGPEATIEDDVEIRNHVVITGRVFIGRGTVLKSHAVIGEEGFGVEYLPDGTLLRTAHLGGVRIGENCLIGSHCSINRGGLKDTILENFVMLDDHVFVGHNSHLKNRVIVTGFANVGGRNTLEEDCWIGPNSTLMNGDLTIGRGALVGIGSLVLRSVPPGMVVQGSPAKTLWPRKGWEHCVVPKKQSSEV